MTRADELTAAFVRLADALGVPATDASLVRELAIRCGWGARDVRAPLLPSGVRHGVPWGVSTAITPAGTRELRVFVEAQCDPPSIDAYWTTALGLTDWIGSRGADLARFRALLDGIAPAERTPYRASDDGVAPSDRTPLRLWHAVAFAPDRALRWHAYLCLPHELAAATLRGIGVGELPSLRSRDRITIVSLDLTAAMRVKAYVLMPDASLDELAALHDRAANSIAGDAQRFGRAMLCEVQRLAPTTLDDVHCLDDLRVRDARQLVDRDSVDRARLEPTHDGARRIWWLAALGFGDRGYETCALHFGVPRHLDEATARTRIRALLVDLELDPASWERAATALGAHHFVTLQRRDGAPRITTYFLPDVAR